MVEPGPILLTGATGFVGSHAYRALLRGGHRVICTSRDSDAAGRRYPDRRFRRLDLREPETLRPAMEGCRAAIYLIHAMRSGGDYATEEREQAMRFREAAADAGLERIVYLGGVRPPAGPVSNHLRSRLQTGSCLRGGPVPTIELRAAMIMGCGSESFRMVRDLGARLPLMILPRWAESRSQPVGIHDVAFALRAAVDLDDVRTSRVYSLPGPEVLTAREILMRTAQLMGRNPRAFGLPLVTPRLSAYWIRLITRAHHEVSRELVEGLRTDLVASEPPFWDLLDYEPQSFDEAVRTALEQEKAQLSMSARLLEQAVGYTFSRRSKS